MPFIRRLNPMQHQIASTIIALRLNDGDDDGVDTAAEALHDLGGFRSVDEAKAAIKHELDQPSSPL